MRYLLAPFALMFWIGSAFRSWLYRAGILSVMRLPAPCVSVGNLTVGGTGKTPIVDVLLTQFEAKGLRTCVLSRGYGRVSEKTLEVQADSSFLDVGDEPLWLKRRHPSAKILVSPERTQAGMKVQGVDVFILDDGMQHLDVHRDFEITVFDGTKPFWHYKLLPLGYARESLNAVRRTDLAVFTRANLANEDELDRLEQKVFRAGVMDATEASLEIAAVENFVGAGSIEIQNSKVFLACGIGSPESFRALVKGGGALIVGMRKFGDHKNFALGDLKNVAQEAAQKQAQFLLITEKDAVKWHELWRKQPFEWPITVGIVKTELTFSPPMIDVLDAIAHGQH